MSRIRNFIECVLPKGAFARNVSLLAGGTALSQFFAVLVAPFLTRLYPVEDFGCFQIYISVMAFGVLAITLRYEQAILLPERDEIAADLFVLSLGVIAISGIIFGLLGWFIRSRGLIPNNFQRLAPYLWILMLGICGAGIYQTLNFWALRLKSYRRVSATKVTQVFSQLTTQVGIGIFHSGPFGLLLGDAIGRISGSLSLGKISWKHSWNVFRKVRFRTVLSSAVRYRHFPLFSTGASMLGAATTALAPLLIAQFYGLKILGLYALSDRVIGAPTILIGQAVSQVYSVEAAASNISDPDALRNLFIRSVKKLSVLGLIPFLIFLIFSPMLFSFIFGRSWWEAGVYAQLLAGTEYLAFIIWPLTPTLIVLERQGWQLAWNSGRMLLAIGSLFLTYHLRYSATAAIFVFSMTMGLGYVVYLILSYRAISIRVSQYRLQQEEKTAFTPHEELAGIEF